VTYAGAAAEDSLYRIQFDETLKVFNCDKRLPRVRLHLTPHALRPL
jgi:hypothetical protein